MFTLSTLHTAASCILSLVSIYTAILVSGRSSVLAIMVVAIGASSWRAIRAIVSFPGEIPSAPRVRANYSACVSAYAYTVISTCAIAQVGYSSGGPAPGYLPLLPLVLSVLLPSAAAILLPRLADEDGKTSSCIVAFVRAAADVLMLALLACLYGAERSPATAWHAAALVFALNSFLGVAAVDNAAFALELAADETEAACAV
jgi:hypothetical protein